MAVARKLEGSNHPRTSRNTRPAGFWIRVVATLIDSTIVGAMNWIFIILAMFFLKSLSAEPGAETSTVQVFKVVMGQILNAIYHCVYYQMRGATIGKGIMGLKVIDISSGKYPSIGKTLLREFIGKWISALLVGIGYFMVGFREDKKGLHDLMAGTRVDEDRT